MRSQLNEEKYTDSHPHKIKAYADDLTYITTKVDHQKGLSAAINSKCESLDLQIPPDKCYSLYIKNGKVLPSEFSISGSLTKCIKSNPTKFLRQIVSMSNNATCRTMLPVNSQPSKHLLRGFHFCR